MPYVGLENKVSTMKKLFELIINNYPLSIIQ